MKLNILQIICLIHYGFTFPNDLFDELWQTNQSGSQENSIESQPKIKIELHEEQSHGRWQNESALKETLKIKHEPHYGAVNVEGTVKIKHEPHSEGVTVKSEQNDESQKDFINIKVEEVGPSVEKHGQLLTLTSAKTKDGAQTYMAHKRQLPVVHDAQTSVSEEAEHESLKMILPLSKSASRIRARSKMPKNESSEEDNCSEESEEANNRLSNETFEESDYSESEDLMEIDHSSNKKDEQHSGKKRIRYTEKEKLEIVNKFLKMKQTLYNNGDKRPYKEINKEIADKLNVHIRTIYVWKKNFGHTFYYSDKEKLEIVNKFLKLKYELYNNKKGKRPYREINKEIADKLNVNIRTIYKWKKDLEHKIIHTEEEKLEIVNKFLQIKQELCNKGDKRLRKEIDKEIADKFGVTIGTVCKWIKQFGFSTLKRFTNEEKIEIVKRFETLKKENPKLKKKEIAKKLQISCTYLNQLIKQIPR